MTERRGCLLYGALAPWWPLLSPVEEYREEAAFVSSLLGDDESPRRTLLELGSGGGHLAAHLSSRFDLTLTDLFEPMLAVSRRRNPGAAHLCADMRFLRLGRVFDAVLVHDAIDYMTNEADLSAAMATIAVHLREGATAVLLPDATTEIFQPGHDTGGSDGDGGRAARYLEWTTDPDPTDTEITTDYVFLLREGGAPPTVHVETHRTGLFPRATWLRLLQEAGLDAVRISEPTSEDRVPRDVFVATRR